MARKPKRKAGQTLAGLDEDDVTGAEEAEAQQMVEFLRRSQPKPAEPAPKEKEPPCRKRRR